MKGPGLGLDFIYDLKTEVFFVFPFISNVEIVLTLKWKLHNVFTDNVKKSSKSLFKKVLR